MQEWAQTSGKVLRQRTVRQENTKYKAGSLPLTCYEDSLDLGKKVKVAKTLMPGETASAPEHNGDHSYQLYQEEQKDEYSSVSESEEDTHSDSDTEESVVQELAFLSRRTRSGRAVKSNTKYAIRLLTDQLLWTFTDVTLV